MRLLPVFAVCASLVLPTAAFAACDQAEIEKLSAENQKAAIAWASNPANQTPDKIQALSDEITKLTQDAQVNATNEEAACQLIRDITAVYSR